MTNIPCERCKSALDDRQRFCGTCGAPGPGILPRWMQAVASHVTEGGSAQPSPQLLEWLSLARYDASNEAHHAALLRMCVRRTELRPPVVGLWSSAGNSLTLAMASDASGCVGGHLLLAHRPGELAELPVPQVAAGRQVSLQLPSTLSGGAVDGLIRLVVPLAHGATVPFQWLFKFIPQASGKQQLQLAPISRPDAARWLLVSGGAPELLFGSAPTTSRPAAATKIGWASSTERGELWVVPRAEARYGRDTASSDVALTTDPPSRAISGHHVTIRVGAGGVTVADVSTYGTKLDGVSLSAQVPTPLPGGRGRLDLAGALELDAFALRGAAQVDGAFLQPANFRPPIQYLQLVGAVGLRAELPARPCPLAQASLALVALPNGAVGLVNLTSRSTWVGTELVAPGAGARLGLGTVEFGNTEAFASGQESAVSSIS